MFSLLAAIAGPCSTTDAGSTAEWSQFFPVPDAYVRDLLVFEVNGITKVLAYAEMGPSEYGWPDFTSAEVHIWDESEQRWRKASWPF